MRTQSADGVVQTIRDSGGTVEALEAKLADAQTIHKVFDWVVDHRTGHQGFGCARALKRNGDHGA
jgi:hypothetical protein